MPTHYTPEQLIKNTAYEIGFSEVGIAGVEPSAQSDRAFDRWIEQGRHGEMRYLEGGSDKRHDPALLLDGARSVVCVSVNYYSKAKEGKNLQRDRTLGGVFSVYAHGRDYHDVLTEMLEELERRLKGFFPRMRAAVCVDTQPISERDFAVRSGIAWLGKNTCVISPRFGSWVFLGELITNLELEPDEPLESSCGSCTRCIDACPTGALDEPFALDATRCISYLTIEKRGDIPSEFHDGIGNNIFGCDECQRVCPFNHAPLESVVFDRDHSSPLLDMELADLAGVTDAEFLELTRGSALRRCKAEGLRRNARIVLNNLPGSAD